MQMDDRPVAFVLPDMRYGGAERIALRLIRTFVEEGQAVDLVLMQKRGELLDQLPSQVRVVDLGASRIRGAIRPLVRYLRQRRPRSMQVRMWPLTIAGIIASKIARVGTHVVVSDHAILSDHYRSKATQAALKLTTRLFYPLANARVAVSAGAARDLANLSGISVGKFTVIHNPVELPSELRSAPDTEAMWVRSGPRILTVGKLKEEKNQQLLIWAFARLAHERDGQLMIAGNGPLLEPLQSLARERGIGEQVLFPGYVADPWPLYASADLFVLPSREESFGNVLVEALHAGLPIVSTRTTGADELLGGGRFGTLVANGDVQALATAMEKALDERSDPQLGRDRARELSGRASLAAYRALLVDLHASTVT
jgi:glycosyltransferase involved in cell wall biosynthesis